MENIFIPINFKRQGYAPGKFGEGEFSPEEDSPSGFSDDFIKTPPVVTEKPINKTLIYVLAYFGFKFFL